MREAHADSHKDQRRHHSAPHLLQSYGCVGDGLLHLVSMDCVLARGVFVGCMELLPLIQQPWKDQHETRKNPVSLSMLPVSHQMGYGQNA